MKVKIKKIKENAVVPKLATEGSACFDLVSTDVGMVNPNFVYGTGLQFEIPKGYVMLVFSRSGMGFKDGIRLANCVGVIDSDYRGEVFVKLHADIHKKQYEAGDRIAQAMIIKHEEVEFDVVEELTDTERGDGGFGHTGVNDILVGKIV